MRREGLPPLREGYFENTDRHIHYVDIPEKSVRRLLIDLLEEYGYKPAIWWAKKDAPRTFLPLIVYTDKKEYSHSGNVTCAAAAATSRVIMDLDEFMIIYERDIRPKEKKEE